MKTSKPERFSCDKSGQWWYTAPDGQRKRCSPRDCPQCGEQFISISRQKCCSHKCGAAFMHQHRPITTKNVPKHGLVKNDNLRYSCDENGQWWYTPGGPKIHGRTRAYIKTCLECGSQFLVSIFHRKLADHCSRKCGQRAWAREHPGHFKGERGGNWKGGRILDYRGYILIHAPDHPSGKVGAYMFEHRLVMEQILGRLLEKHEHVHHKNGIRDDNRPENLELWAKHHPPGQRKHEQQTELQKLKARIAELEATLKDNR